MRFTQRKMRRYDPRWSNKLVVEFSNCSLYLQAEETEINSLFQKIYASANPEVQRAMNKSFTESGKFIKQTIECIIVKYDLLNNAI